MSIETKVKRLKTVYKPPQDPIVCIEISKEDVNKFADIEDWSEYTLTLQKRRKKSMNMNSYMWVLCDKIAQKIDSSKEEVYRLAIKQAGKWVDVSCPHDKKDEIISSWEHNGLGWFGEIMYDGDITNLRLYMGSSVYTGDELQRVTNDVVEEAKALGIETMTPIEIESLKSMWDGK